MSDTQNELFMNSLCCIAQAAGEVILGYYQQDVAVERKADSTPVTAADKAANALIVEQLQELAPQIPIISEEVEPHVLPEHSQRFWLVDPLDGTKSFLREEGEFTVNIALLDHTADGRFVPAVGIIYIPVSRQLYAGQVGAGAWRQWGDGPPQAIATRDVPAEGMTAVVSLSHRERKTDDFLAALPISERVSAASSLKFCRVAEGAADIYPRFGPTMEWDTAAGHAIVLAAGGRVETPEGEPFTYGRPDFRNGPFVVWGN